MTIHSRIAGTGSYLPALRLSNDDLVARLAKSGLETSDEWIKTRSGIEARHFASDDELTSDLGMKAAQAAMASANCTAADLDLIILATSTPDHLGGFPSTACVIQDKLGAHHGCAAFDVQAVCAGFMYAMAVADAMIRTGSYRKVLVIGAEVFSRILDFQDRTTCVLFGDGAGAMLIAAQKDETSDRGILATALRSDGRYKDILYVDGGVSMQTTGHLRMQGKEVFRHAVEKLSNTALEAIEAAGLTTDDVDWIVPHQANKRILEGMSKRLKVPMDRVVMTVNNHGNTSAASIPLAMAVAAQDKRIKQGDIVVTGAIGGGLAWGTAVIRW